MPKMRQLLSEDERIRFEAIRYMSERPDAVEAMTRTQLYEHMNIRERMLRAKHGDDWRRYYDTEFAEKREVWAAARDLHEVEKEARKRKRWNRAK